MWHVVDAKGQVWCYQLDDGPRIIKSQIVGRLATQVAKILQGKHKPTFNLCHDNGDYVVVTNVQDIAFSGKKGTDKLYRWHTGYPGGLKTLTARQMYERAPDRILRKAVYGMLPKNRLRQQRIKRLRIFADEAHEHFPNVKGSENYAPQYADRFQPKKFELKGGDDATALIEFLPEDAEWDSLGDEIELEVKATEE